MNEKHEVSNHLRRFREIADLTQTELADLLSVSRQSIIALEAGKCLPSVSLALKISTLFDMPVEFIFRYDKMLDESEDKNQQENNNGGDMARDLLPWSPLREIMSMREAVDKFFDEPALTGASALFHPQVGIRETDKLFVIEADIPGVKEEDLDVEIERDKVIIRGERKHEQETKREDYYHLESSYGSFSRVISLPSYVDVDNADAEISDGMLKVKIPKIEEKKSKKLKPKISISEKKAK